MCGLLVSGLRMVSGFAVWDMLGQAPIRLEAGLKEKNEMLPHIPELDGVRGIAILVVLITHFYDPVQAAAPFGSLTRVISHGGAGVDLFFVLSGFLITGILVSTKDAVNYFRAFYARRAVRIFPLYIVVVFFFFYVAVPISQHYGKDMWVQPREQIWYWLFLANWRHALGYNDGAQLAHFWSLAIEEQFYLGWSLVVWFASRRSMPMISLGVILAVVIGRTVAAAHGVSGLFLYFSTVTRLDSLAFGALLSVSLRTREFFGRFAFLILPGCIVLVLVGMPLQVTMLLYGIGSAALVGLATTRAVPLLRMRWLRTFGKYSYGLYVLHYLFHGLFVLGVGYMKPLPFAVLSITFGIALSFGAAWVSWKVLETPFLKLKKRYKYRFVDAAV